MYMHIQIHMIYITLCPKQETLQFRAILGFKSKRVLVQAALLRALPGALEKLGLGAPPERLLGWSWVS